MNKSSQWKNDAKACVEKVQQLDVRQLQRTGRLQNGMDYGWSWSRGGAKVASIDLSVQSDQVLMQYSRCLRNGQWHRSTSEVKLERTPCNFGGERVWWRCPVAGCDRRAAILYGGAGIACRHCHDLAYRCQRESEEYRAARQANKIRRKLGWNIGILNVPGGKPKGMHWKTFERMQATHDRHSQTALACMTESLAAIRHQIERLR